MLPGGLEISQSPKEITLQKLLLVEGHDAFQFFKAFLRHLNLLSRIEIRNYGGIDQIDFLGTLKMTSGFERVTSLAVIRDAESSAPSAFQSVCGFLKAVGLGVPQSPMLVAQGPPRVSVFVLPDCHDPGNLETLCLRTVETDPAMLCVKDFFACLEKDELPKPRNMPKASLLAFLASKENTTPLLGQAAHKGYWPWDHPALNSLRQFLVNISRETVS